MQRVVPSMLAFPEGDDLLRVIHEFSGLCSLPCCAGAMDGTFMKIEKPCKWGDAYFCYKKHMAIILFVCVDARGRFTYVSAGGAGQVGDAAIWNRSALKAQIENGSWLAQASMLCLQIRVIILI